ncbi:acyl carrier protein [Yoonia sediminilitoris]|uniref:Acyl carrier protein n=1 Tax=Yoonia sediminilitoris TaxID=1286148 RepID=A0A2T6KER8_9RHOB|nr:acyl carrier protein [Yoonia sediminilitoris]PUB13616.1 acyl carrier protein [Yoonia sediminilitoris]RCW94786.1 acyl carrier protein [Yoonia sediminilitoris]
MNDKDIRALMIRQLGQIAPDVPFDTVDPDADLRDEFDIDSMDFLTLITALGKELGLSMPETDYDQMRSFVGLQRYLSSHVT